MWGGPKPNFKTELSWILIKKQEWSEGQAYSYSHQRYREKNKPHSRSIQLKARTMTLLTHIVPRRIRNPEYTLSKTGLETPDENVREMWDSLHIYEGKVRCDAGWWGASPLTELPIHKSSVGTVFYKNGLAESSNYNKIQHMKEHCFRQFMWPTMDL